MLLNHTSGIDGQMLPDQATTRKTIEKGVARFCDLGQILATGTSFFLQAAPDYRQSLRHALQ